MSKVTAPTSLMRVAKYIPERMYGFLQPDSGDEVFFHLRVFHPPTEWTVNPVCAACALSCQWAEAPPPPILGEEVEVEMDTSSLQSRAKTVTRLKSPLPVAGKVDTFDVTRGYGFIRGEDDVVYHLHRSEVVEGRLPIPSQSVMFFAGVRQGKPRACHIRICGDV